MKGQAGLPAIVRRPKPVEDIQNRAGKEQAIASRAIRDRENSCIDKLRRRGVDARESAADGAAGILDGGNGPVEGSGRPGALSAAQNSDILPPIWANLLSVVITS
jgi:hypothetical protein